VPRAECHDIFLLCGLVVPLPHTTALRGNRWEPSIPKLFLKPGAFHLQQVQSVSVARLERRLVALTSEEWRTVQNRDTSACNGFFS
jgi:hypothetical protein